MFDWIGSLRVVEQSQRRLVLGLSAGTRIAGAVMIGGGALLAWRVADLSLWLAAIPAAVALFGLVLFTLGRELVFDREAGVLRLDQRAFGIRNRSVVPLFHLRAVVVCARSVGLPRRVLASPGFVAYIDRRVGEAIFLDEARRSAGLFRMAEAIAEVAELRLEYEAAPTVDGEIA